MFSTLATDFKLFLIYYIFNVLLNIVFKLESSQIRKAEIDKPCSGARAVALRHCLVEVEHQLSRVDARLTQVGDQK